MLMLLLICILSRLCDLHGLLTCGSHVQVGRATSTNSIWQHLPGNVKSGAWLELHDGAGGNPGAAEAMPHKADL